jgi:uncharacterized membrane protein
MPSTTDIRRITLTALLAALIFVLTRYLQILIPATQGYIHLGDAGITFAAYAFGPWAALLSGGLGTALADLSSGYAQWAFLLAAVHGAQGGRWVGSPAKKLRRRPWPSASSWASPSSSADTFWPASSWSLRQGCDGSAL